MKSFIPTRIAEIIYALVMIAFGVNHFTKAEGMALIVPSFIPGGIIWVYVSGAGLLLAAIAIIINKLKGPACYLLAVLLLIIVFTVDVPGIMNAGDENTKILPMIMMLKDAGLAMGAIIIGNNVSK